MEVGGSRWRGIPGTGLSGGQGKLGMKAIRCETQLRVIYSSVYLLGNERKWLRLIVCFINPNSEYRQGEGAPFSLRLLPAGKGHRHGART